VAGEAEYPARTIRRTRDEIEPAAVIQRTLPLRRTADLDLRKLVHWTRLRTAVPRARLAACHSLRNGVPFASPNALFNLSKLSVWWLRLGIAIERIKPGHPQQTGRHERMHLNLKKGNNPATGLQQPAAAGTLRCLRPRVQCRTAA